MEQQVSENKAEGVEVQTTGFMQVLDENGQPPAQPEVTVTTSASEEVPVVKDMKQIVEDREKEARDFMSNKDNQDKAFQLGLQMFDIMGSKPFTLDKLYKRTSEKEKVVLFQKLKLLEMFGYCIIRKGDPMNPKERNETMFQLTVTLEHKIEALQAVIAGKEAELETLKNTLKIWLVNKPKPTTEPYSSAMELPAAEPEQVQNP